MKKWILCLLIFSLPSFAQNVVVENFTGVSEEKIKSKARKEILKQAIEKVSLRYVIEIIGEEKAQRNKGLISNKIIKNSRRYILTQTTGAIEKKEGKFTMPVTMKMSVANLQKILLAEGLLYKLSGPPAVLPVIAFSDRVNSKSHRWWTSGQKEKGFLTSRAKDIHEQIKRELWNLGFYGMLPAERSWGPSLPAVFNQESLQKEDLLFVGSYFGAAIVVRGDVRFRALRSSLNTYAIELKLEAIHSGNGRVIGEVIRSYETETGNFEPVVLKKISEVKQKIAKDLSVQIFDAWKRGTFGASLLKLTVRGKLNYNDLKTLKKKILTQVKDIKTLKERLFEPNQVTFEVDAEANPQKLAEALGGSKFGPLKVQVKDIRTDGLMLSVKRL